MRGHRVQPFQHRRGTRDLDLGVVVDGQLGPGHLCPDPLANIRVARDPIDGDVAQIEVLVQHGLTVIFRGLDGQKNGVGSHKAVLHGNVDLNAHPVSFWSETGWSCKDRADPPQSRLTRRR